MFMCLEVEVEVDEEKEEEEEEACEARCSMVPGGLTTWQQLACLAGWHV